MTGLLWCLAFNLLKRINLSKSALDFRLEGLLVLVDLRSNLGPRDAGSSSALRQVGDHELSVGVDLRYGAVLRTGIMGGKLSDGSAAEQLPQS